MQHTGDQVAGIGHVGGLNLENIPTRFVVRVTYIQAGRDIKHRDALVFEVVQAGLHDMAAQTNQGKHLVLLHQTLNHGLALSGIVLVVIGHQLHLAAPDAALGVEPLDASPQSVVSGYTDVGESTAEQRLCADINSIICDALGNFLRIIGGGTFSSLRRRCRLFTVITAGTGSQGKEKCCCQKHTKQSFLFHCSISLS